ncbi:NADH:ubiquinone reductase (non-electrogenic) [Mytilus galloprovincialis]|uniref:NADH:ubiquinone reductase (Non-electrogenic) n=1 Tax=Mytilus galloprovincialis TaxID=29158 RepID=A0A8B6CAN6_MYTGA|nr:NADH:ubiquinone reductase (non-electrogenic) [Mytilus galloprovincialis]
MALRAVRQLVSRGKTNLAKINDITNPTSTEKRERLVILGTGWGSYSVLKTIDKNKFDVIVVSPRNHFLFTPLLCSTTVGTLEFRSVIEPVRNTIFRQPDHFHLSFATKLDIENKKIHCESVLKSELKYTIDFDKLVIGVGALSNTFNVPGVQEHSFFLKEVADARRIRNRILKNFELSVQPGIEDSEANRLLHTVIVGGGPTGVEFGAELYDFVEQDISRLYKQKKHHVNVTLVESNQILASFDESLRKYAEKKIKERDRFQLVKSIVTEVKEDCVTLSNGETIPCGMVVWSGGIAPRQFVRDLDLKKNKQGQVMTDKYLHVLGDDSKSVFAIGDCADVQDMPLPCTAQVAEREGRYLAKMLNHGKEFAEPFKFQSMGMLAYIGKYQALTDVKQIKMQGFTSWIVWRSAYLTRLGSWRLRMQVPIDWLKH